jgi:hypothetical protein
VKKGALLAGTSILLAVALIQPFTLRPGHPWLLLVPQLIFTLLTPFCGSSGKTMADRGEEERKMRG